MSVVVTKNTNGPFYSSGAISFSSLRSNFKETSSGAISASELRRNDNNDESNPIVPNSTENVNISPDNNLRIGGFRNSIKRYFATQSEEDNNASYPNEPGFRMGRYDSNGRGIDWSGGGVPGPDGQGGGTSGNLTRNVQKRVYINGTCGSNNVGQAAAQIDPASYVRNLTIEVNGSILGAGGAGGVVGAGDGTSGGTALNCSVSSGGSVTVIVGSNARIYGGGGGGEKGQNGQRGVEGVCWYYSTKSVGSGCNSCGDCGSGWERYGGCDDAGGCNCGGWWLWSGCKDQRKSSAECRQATYYTVPGGQEGYGGSGGPGRGYNNQTGSLDGSSGQEGQDGGSCGTNNTSSSSGKGTTGNQGGRGGEWGESGEETTAVWRAGSAGYSIVGTRATITGATYNLRGPRNN